MQRQMHLNPVSVQSSQACCLRAYLWGEERRQKALFHAQSFVGVAVRVSKEAVCWEACLLHKLQATFFGAHAHQEELHALCVELWKHLSVELLGQSPAEGSAHRPSQGKHASLVGAPEIAHAHLLLGRHQVDPASIVQSLVGDARGVGVGLRGPGGDRGTRHLDLVGRTAKRDDGPPQGGDAPQSTLHHHGINFL